MDRDHMHNVSVKLGQEQLRRTLSKSQILNLNRFPQLTPGTMACSACLSCAPSPSPWLLSFYSQLLLLLMKSFNLPFDAQVNIKRFFAT